VEREDAKVIVALNRVLWPTAFSDHDTGPFMPYRRIEAAVDRLTWPDVPDRILVRALTGMLRRPSEADDSSDEVALPLAEEVVRRDRIQQFRRRIETEGVEAITAPRPERATERETAAESQASIATVDTDDHADDDVHEQDDEEGWGDGPFHEARSDEALQLLHVLRDILSEDDIRPFVDADGGLDLAAELTSCLSEEFLAAAFAVPCAAQLVPADGTHPRTLQVMTDERRLLTIEQVHPCIQPLNWPKCNDSFHGMGVVHGSFQRPAADVTPFEAIIQPHVAGFSIPAENFRCVYEETVELPAVVDGGDMADTTDVTTRLDCIEWTRRDASGATTEVGMAYRHAEPDPVSCVDVDEGFAIVEVDETTGTPMVRIRSLKRISFDDDQVLTYFDSQMMCDLFCLIWSSTFDITTDVCTDRSVVEPGEVEQRSAGVGGAPVTPVPPNGGGPGAGDPGHWLPPWIDDAREYWGRAVAIGSRELERLEERRQSSTGLRTQDAFYDGLETWETNRRSLHEGLSLTIEFWEHMVEGLK
jgi:hypothetical protein